MSNQSFSTTLVVDKSLHECFAAINNVRGWWSEQIQGHTDQLNAKWSYNYKDVHTCQIKIVDFVPDTRVEWLVEHNTFNFTKDKSEWIGTRIRFELSNEDGGTRIVFTHDGLVPEYECYDICHNAWTTFIQDSLGSLIRSGKGQPNPKEL